jgi:hypothetical protein
MKRTALVIVCLIAVFFTWRYFATNPVEERYKQFAEQMLQRRYDAAAAMADGLTAADLRELGTQEQIGAGPAMFQALFPSRFVIDARENAPGGGVVLHATQTVLFNPAGVESIRPAMFARMKQVVTLRQSGGAWKVTAFANSFEKMDSLTAR